jgi:hypothetical protein
MASSMKRFSVLFRMLGLGIKVTLLNWQEEICLSESASKKEN